MGAETIREYRPLRECTSTGSISYGIVQPGTHVEDGVPIIRVNNINDGSLDLSNPLKVDHKIDDKHRKTKLEGGEVLLSLVGTTGQCIVTGQELKGWNVARAIAVIKPAQGISAEWLSICLKSKDTQHFLDCRANTTVQKTLNLKDVREIPIMKVAEEEERYILKWWMTLNNKIELNRRMNETLEGMAQALFKSWFVDFDPVIDNALEAGNPIPEEFDARIETRRKALADGTANREAAKQFPAAFQETDEMGWIPKGWEVNTIEHEYNVVMGQSPKGDTYNEDGDGTLFYQGRAEFGWRFPVPRLYTTDPKRMAKAGDALMSVRAPVGDFNMALNDCCIGRGLCALRHKSGGPSFTYYQMKDFQKYLEKFNGEGTVFGSVNQKDLKALGCLAPAENAVYAFVWIVEKMDVKIHGNSNQISTLTELRDTLLPKLISGELQVGNIAREAS